MATMMPAAHDGRQAGLHMRIVQRFLRTCDLGQSLVEFAITLPVLLLVVTGIMAFGITINSYVQLTEATNVGARQLAISRGTTDPCATVAGVVYAAAPLLTKANITFKTTLNGTSYSGTSCSSTAAAANLSQGSTASVQVTYPCSLKVYGASLVPSCVLMSQTAELVQ